MLCGDMELRIQEGWASWRWTHGFAEDVAEAVVRAVSNSSSVGRIDNVGESYRPTMAERLAQSLPAWLIGRDTYLRFWLPSQVRRIGCLIISPTI